MSSEDVPPVTVWVRFPVRVPEGTDPREVVRVANQHLNDDDGLLCQWGRWLPGDAELVGP